MIDQLDRKIVRWCCAAIVCAFSTCAIAADSTTLPAATTLRAAAGDRLLIGTAIMASHLREPAHARLLAGQFNAITGGNEFKPDALQKINGKFTFERADEIVSFARENRMQVIGHTLVWHNQSPKWLYEDAAGKPLARETALENMRRHITTVVTHFKGKVKGWDVVNEAISDGGNDYLRDTPARRAIGDDYVEKAFEFARNADPDVELYYNDYNIELPGKREKCVRLLRELKAKGLRVDAVGIQGHWQLKHPAAQVIEDAIRAFAAEGVKVHVTELDIDVLPRTRQGAEITDTEKEGANPYVAGLPADIAGAQGDRYRSLFEVFVKFPGVVTRITFWGSHDGNTWLNDWPVRGRTNHPLLWDRQLQPKPAFDGVIDVLNKPSGG
ncbi:MAG: endo-1,4-beta-xylanase [Burkholderiales bacterium]|nr:endo-1,4-beta-xylanase [Phycisphaerae bacterium]